MKPNKSSAKRNRKANAKMFRRHEREQQKVERRIEANRVFFLHSDAAVDLRHADDLVLRAARARQ